MHLPQSHTQHTPQAGRGWGRHVRDRVLSALRPPWREALLVAAGVALAYWLLWPDLPRIVGTADDDGVYVALGKAIATGQGYHSIYAVGAPVHLKYPPGLPLLYAGLWRLGHTLAAVIGAASALSVLATAAAAGILWWIARTKLGLGWWMTLLWAVGPFFLDGALLYFSLPLSEPYFMLGWAAALVLWYRVRDRPAAGLAAALGAVLAATILFRAQAVAILAGLLLALGIARVAWRRILAVGVAAALPLAAWVGLHARMTAAGPLPTQPDEAGYLHWHGPAETLRIAASAIRANWAAYWDQFARYVSPAKPAGVALLALCLALAAVGAYRLRQRHAGIVWSTVASIGLVMVWPWSQDRLVFTSLPFAGLLVAAGIQAGVERAERRVHRMAQVVLAILAVSVAARQATLRIFAYVPQSPERVLGLRYPGYMIALGAQFIPAISRWIRQNTSVDDRILVDNSAAIYLYTGRRTVEAFPAFNAQLLSRRGYFLASRIAADSVTVVVLTTVGHPLVPDVAVFYQRCPGVLRYLDHVDWWGGRGRSFIYRVTSPDGCVRDKFLGPPGPP